MICKIRPMNQVNYLGIFDNLTGDEQRLIKETEMFEYPVMGMSAVFLEDRLIAIRSKTCCSLGEVMQTITAVCDRYGYVKGYWVYQLDCEVFEVKSTPMSLEECWDRMHRDFVNLP